MKSLSLILNSFIVILLTTTGILAQDNQVRIALVTTEENQEDPALLNSVRQEIISLLGANYSMDFESIAAPSNPTSIRLVLDQAFQSEEIDVIIGVGVLPSMILGQRTNFEKPSIATIVIDSQWQQFPLSEDRSSGVSNFTYIQSPFSIRRDLKTFQEIVDFQHLGVVLPRYLIPIADTYLAGLLSNYTLLGIDQGSSVPTFVEQLSPEVDAIYTLPLEGTWDDAERREFFDKIASREIPSFALPGAVYVEQGALASIAPSHSIRHISRHVAISLSRILQGEDPAKFQVDYELYHDAPAFNMQTAQMIGVYPDWEWLSEADLFQIDEEKSSRILNLPSTIYEALQHNLSLKIAKNEADANEHDITIARSDLLPQASVSTAGVLIDPDRAEASFGLQPNFRWLGSAQLTQVIYAEPVYANVAIQKLLQESRKYSVDQKQLDVILETSEAYLTILKAKSLVRLQNDNVRITKQNLAIAQTNEAVGQQSTNDVYRWEAQLSLNKISLNDALVSLQSSKYRLNQLLNRPLDEDFQLEEPDLEDDLIMLSDERLLANLADQGRFRAFVRFMEAEAMQNLPELKQLNMAIAANDRQLTSQKRSFYTPSVLLSSEANYTIADYHSSSPPEFTELGGLFPETNELGWNIGVGIQLPVFQGNRRRAQIEKTTVQSLQLQNQELDLRNQLSLRLRTSLENARVSYAEINLARNARSAAEENLTIALNAYINGIISIAQLIDAQNAALQTRELAVNAVYQFLIDFLRVERSIGNYYFLQPEAEQEAFLQRFIQYLIEK